MVVSILNFTMLAGTARIAVATSRGMLIKPNTSLGFAIELPVRTPSAKVKVVVLVTKAAL